MPRPLRLALLVSTLCLSLAGTAGAGIIYSEDFETDGDGSRYQLSHDEEFSRFGGYFFRTDGSEFGSEVDYGGADGFYFAVGEPNGPRTLSVTGIDISGMTNLSFTGLFAEDDDQSRESWNVGHHFHLTYSIDGGPAENLLWLESESATGTGAPRVDADFDGVGEGTEVTDQFGALSAAIAGTGSTLDLTATFGLDNREVDLAIDGFRVSGIAAPASVPEPASVALIGLAAAGGWFARRRA